MKLSRMTFIKGAVVFLLAVWLAACAKPYHLNVNYTLPESPATLDKTSIAVEVVDARKPAVVFSEKARNEFDKWDGTFVLADPAMETSGNEATDNFTELIRQALKKRLNSMNVDVVNEGTDGLPVLKLTLKKFFLDLKGRNWISDFRFDVELSKDGSKTGREQVKAQAERTKVMGKGGGQKLISDIFSEGINRLNLEKLFENAGF